MLPSRPVGDRPWKGEVKLVDEFRGRDAVLALASAIRGIAAHPWSVMEVCGGQTHTLLRFGLDELLPPGVTMIHGPGCPVCVTPVEAIDAAIALSRTPDTVLCSFGDMLRVPGGSETLASARASGGEVRVVYSPMDALEMAAGDTRRQYVFFAVGFETTAPVTAAAVLLARKRRISNFSLLCSHVRVPPAVEALLSRPRPGIEALVAPGHVCTVMGCDEYEYLSTRFGIPVVVTGFEPVDLMQGILMCVESLEAGRANLTIQYSRSVKPEGNREARKLMDEVFEAVDRQWRGLGIIPMGGMALRDELHEMDASRRFGVSPSACGGDGRCMAGRVLSGAMRPSECPWFGGECSPEHPLGAPMVSSEGACAAYHRYRPRTGREAGHD